MLRGQLAAKIPSFLGLDYEYELNDVSEINYVFAGTPVSVRGTQDASMGNWYRTRDDAPIWQTGS